MSLAVEWVILGVTAPLLLLPSSRPTLTVVALALLSLYWLFQIARREPWPTTPFSAPLLVFAIMAALSVLITTAPELTLPKATGMVLGLALFRSAARLQGRQRLTWALAGLLVASMGVWALGLMDLAWPAKLPLVQGLLDRIPRNIADLPGSPAGGVSPNQLAGTLALVIPLALAAAAGSGAFARGRLLMALGLAGVALWGITLFLTQSRGGWIGGLAGIVFLVSLWGLSGRRKWHGVVGIGLPLLVAAAGLALVAIIGPDRIGQIVYGADGAAAETAVGAISFRGRVEIWQRALDTIRDFPYTGRGLGTFRQSSPLLYPLFTVGPDKDIAHAHNVFLQIGVDLGLPGLLSYVSLIVLAFWRGWQKISSGGAQRWLALGALAGMVGYHVYGLADVVSMGSKPSFLFWWVLGLLAAGSEA